ncbi:MAG TPA: glycerophosphodiester phosphodiesterase family protein, partial [Gammaproteobacteria bacterium]|nr:glycerophosphodiester phosphodiesterase family protein [Gammaproteobacteria bacterium]
MLILGHRGVRSDDLRENTLEAFQRAVDLGADGIETDVRRTRDGRLVLFHDRLSPAGTPVAQLGHAALEAAAGHHVPELGEALAAWPDLLWDLEIKTPDFPGPLKRALSGRTGTRLILTSPHHEFLLAHGPDLGLPFGPVINHRPPSAEALLGPWRGSPPAYCVWNVDHLDGEILGAVREA